MVWKLRKKESTRRKVAKVLPVKSVRVKPVKSVRPPKPVAPVGHEYYWEE